MCDCDCEQCVQCAHKDNSGYGALSPLPQEDREYWLQKAAEKVKDHNKLRERLEKGDVPSDQIKTNVIEARQLEREIIALLSKATQ